MLGVLAIFTFKLIVGKTVFPQPGFREDIDEFSFEITNKERKLKGNPKPCVFEEGIEKSKLKNQTCLPSLGRLYFKFKRKYKGKIKKEICL